VVEAGLDKSHKCKEQNLLHLKGFDLHSKSKIVTKHVSPKEPAAHSHWQLQINLVIVKATEGPMLTPGFKPQPMPVERGSHVRVHVSCMSSYLGFAVTRAEGRDS